MKAGLPTVWLSRSCDLPTVCSRWPLDWRINKSPIKLIQQLMLASVSTFTVLSENEMTIQAKFVPLLQWKMGIIVEDDVGVME